MVCTYFISEVICCIAGSQAASNQVNVLHLRNSYKSSHHRDWTPTLPWWFMAKQQLKVYQTHSLKLHASKSNWKKNPSLSSGLNSGLIHSKAATQAASNKFYITEAASKFSRKKTLCRGRDWTPSSSRWFVAKQQIKLHQTKSKESPPSPDSYKSSLRKILYHRDWTPASQWNLCQNQKQQLKQLPSSVVRKPFVVRTKLRQLKLHQTYKS